MSISPHHRAISPPTPAPSPQPDLHTSIRIANNVAAASGSSAPHPLAIDPQDPAQLLKHLSLVLPQYTQSARFKLISEFADLLSLRELAHLSSVITPRLKVDFLSALPIEVSLNILSFIDDPKTLARASCVSRFWRSLVNDEHTWKAMCLKHKYRRRGSSNAALLSNDDRLMRSIAGTPRIAPLSLATTAPAASSSASTSPLNTRAAGTSSLGVLLEQPARAAASIDDDDDAEEYNDEDDAAVLASLYQRYRDRGLDPSNALHELRTLHDLFLSKQNGAVNDSMSEADLAFYAQLEEIVQEESLARYGDQDSVFSSAAPVAASSSSQLTATPIEANTAHLGWLSAGPSVAAGPSTSSSSTHAISENYRTASGKLDRLQGWQSQQQRCTPAPLTTPSAHESAHNNDSDDAMDMDDQDDVASTAGPRDVPPVGQPPNAPVLASLPHHVSPTSRFSAATSSPSTSTRAASSRAIAASSSLVPGPRDIRPRAGRSARRSSASVDEDDPTTAPAGLGLGNASSSRSPVHERSAVAGPSRHTVSSPSTVHARRRISAKMPFSYRTHFKMAYLTESNWRKGGRLQTQHVSADAGHVVTSLAIDSEWIVVGMANAKIHVFSAETGLYAHTLLGHDAGVWCLTLISRTGKGSKGNDAEVGARGKGKMVITDPEDGSGGKPYRAAADGDLRLVHHDPRPDAADALLSPPISSIELPEEEGMFSGRRLPSASSAPGSGKARQTYGHGETLEWFHKARRALRRQQSAKRAAAAGGAAASGLAGSLPVQSHLQMDDHGDSDADLSVRSEGLPQSSSSAKIDRENARAIAEAEAGAIRDAVMADGTGQVPAELAEKIRANGGGVSDRAEHSRTRTASATAAQLTGNAAGNGNPCGSVLGYGNSDAIVVSGGCDRDVRVWDLRTGQCKHVLHGHTSTVRCLKVLDGKPIAVSGSRDSTLRVWNVETGEHLHLLAGHQHSVRCIEVAGNRVASGSYDGTCRVWDLSTGRCLHNLRGHIHYIYAVAFDGHRVATGSLDSTVRVWSAETGECLALFQGHTSLVGQLQLLDNYLVTGGSDGRVIVFSLSTYECLHRLCAHDNSVTCLQFDERYIVTGGNDGRVKLWDFVSGKFIREICEPAEQVWKVSYRDDKVVVLCKRGERTCMDVITFRPSGDEM